MLRQVKMCIMHDGGNNSLTDISIIQRSYYVTLKNLEFLNFVVEGYQQKLNHGKNFLIYGTPIQCTMIVPSCLASVAWPSSHWQ